MPPPLRLCNHPFQSFDQADPRFANIGAVL
jgi:hypothetical protein